MRAVEDGVDELVLELPLDPELVEVPDPVELPVAVPVAPEEPEVSEDPELLPVVDVDPDEGAVVLEELPEEPVEEEVVEVLPLEVEEAALPEGPPNRTRMKAPTLPEVDPTATGGSLGFRADQSGITERSVWETDPSTPKPKAKPSIRRCSGNPKRSTAP